MTGYFITFEGGEGSGKSTQIARLAERLRAEGRTVLATREPGGTPGADAIRHAVLSGATEALGTQIETMLFAAARTDHIEALIAPALARGEVVLCDRFHDSTRVYQSIDAERTPQTEDLLEKVSLVGVYPDLTVILDVPATQGIERAKKRRGRGDADRFEKEDVALHEKRRQAFLQIADSEPDRCVVVDGTQGMDVIADEIAEIVDDRLNAARFEAIGNDLNGGRTAP